MFSLKKKILFLVSLVVFAAFGTSWLLLHGVVRNGIIKQGALELSRQTELLSLSLAREGVPGFLRDLERWRGALHGRVTLIDTSGAVLADTERNPSAMDNHLSRPEVQEALSSGEGEAVRYSRTTNTYSLYFARRVPVEGGRAAVIRSSYTLDYLSSLTREIRNRFLLNLLFAVVLVLGFGAWFVRIFFRPLERMVTSAGRIAQGEEARFPLMAEPELQRLSSALDGMSAQLRGALSELRTEREDLSRIVTALPVGVLLIDEERKVRYVNEMASALLSLKTPPEEGTPVERVLPSGDMYAMVLSALQGGEESRVFALPEPGGRYVRITSGKTATGVLLVLSDLTEERRIEQSRREFIADAGHELQTPLTTIRAAAEYLLETPEKEEGEEEKYLSTIIAQQERMSRLVDDLLLLSRMESEVPVRDAEDADLTVILGKIADESRAHPFAEFIDIREEFPPEAPVRVRADDISRALLNLSENAVKYVREKFGPNPGGMVSLSIGEKGGSWSVMVCDNGPGIAEDAAPVIFDRFRRGDGHRARGEWGKGGYGLGLAIAKRILVNTGGDLLFHPSENGAVFEALIPKK